MMAGTPQEEFDALAAQTFSEIYLAVETSPLDRVTKLPVPDFVTTAPRLFTEQGEIIAGESTGFKSVILGGWRLTRRLTQRGKFTAPSTFNAGRLILSNAPPAKGEPGPLDSWLTLDFNDRPIVIKAGGRFTHDGLPYPYASYHPIFTGVTEDLITRADGSVELVLVGRAKALSRPVVEELYRGLGGGAVTTGLSSLDAPSDAAWSLNNLTIEWTGVIRSGGSWLIFHDSTHYGIAIGVGSELGVFDDIGFTPSDFIVPLDTLVSVASTYETVGGSTEVVLYAGSDSRDVSEVLRITIAPLAVPLGSLRVARSFNSVVETFSARIWSSVRSQEQLLNNVDGLLATPLTENDLLEEWRFSEGVGDTVAGSKKFSSLVYTMPPLTWVSSLEGDDPVQFPGGPTGQSKPRVLGPASNVGLTAVDSQRHDHQWCLGASDDLERVYSSGGPLFPDETVLTVGDGEIVYDKPTMTLTIVSGGHTFHRFVPGQANPAVTGQQITVTGAGPKDGTFTIGVGEAGISQDGLVMGLIDVSPGVASGDLPGGSEIRSAVGDRQYTFDLTNSTINLPTSLPGQLTADVVGELSGASGSKLSELFEILVGESVDTSRLSFDPPVGIAFAKGGEIETKTALDQLVRSGMAYWIEERTGGYRLGTFALPAGTPVATVSGSKLSELGDAFTAPIIGRISKISPIRTKIPAWRLNTAYARTWVTEESGSLVGALTDANRARFSTRFRFAPRTVIATRDRYPTSEPLAPIETYLLHREDAEQHLGIGVPLLTQKTRFYDVTVEGLALFSVEPGDVIWLQHPDPTFQITTPVKSGILALVEDTSRDTVQLEAFTGE